MATQWKYKHALIYYHCSKMVLDEIYKAMALYRQRKYDQCVDLCNKLMVGSIYQKMAYELKMRAMTQRVYIDDIEADDGVESEYRLLLSSTESHISLSHLRPSQ